jgi:hypothetical protein
MAVHAQGRLTVTSLRYGWPATGEELREEGEPILLHAGDHSVEDRFVDAVGIVSLRAA